MPEQPAARWASVDGFIENINLRKINIKPEPYINCDSSGWEMRIPIHVLTQHIYTHAQAHQVSASVFILCEGESGIP